jgi:alkanesulfonate monooxygenase SsuD/methylene tetrahydromethanopterin reductase-like flavin-dependent oxidoreductase (luciferase family)
MRLGIALPFAHPSGDPLTAEDVARCSRMIEEAGFDGIWIGDTFARGRPWPDPLLWLSIACAATHQIEVGTSVLQLPLYHPLELARRLLTLHALSNGRFTVGVGAGSTKSDFDSLGVEFEQRFVLFDRSLEAIDRVFRGDDEILSHVRPWPQTHGGPPLLIGSWRSPSWIRRAARTYDGWIASATVGIKRLEEGIRVFKLAGGQRAVAASLAVDLSDQRPPASNGPTYDLCCSSEDAAEQLARLAGLGYDDALLHVPKHVGRPLAFDDLLAIRALTPPHLP